MDKLISFIVPLHNEKLRLNTCVSSMLDQNLEEGSFEIILVDDGSTDGSDEICRHLAEEYPCIRTVSQPNQGISVARNVGIGLAEGQYLCFVDSDDSLAPGRLHDLVPYCNGHYDLIRFWCEIVVPGTQPAKEPDDGHVIFDGTGHGYLREIGLETFCCCYLYRRAFLTERKLAFRPGILGEDTDFIFNVLMADPVIVSVARRVYRYIIHPDTISTTRSIEHSRRWTNDLRNTLARISSALEPFRESDPLLYQRCRQSLETNLIPLFSRVLSADYSWKEYRSLLDSCRRDGLLPMTTSPMGWRDRKIRTAITLLTRIPVLYHPASRWFRKVFLPHIYPNIDRNG